MDTLTQLEDEIDAIDESKQPRRFIDLVIRYLKLFEKKAPGGHPGRG
jgi:hypothetical protein